MDGYASMGVPSAAARVTPWLVAAVGAVAAVTVQVVAHGPDAVLADAPPSADMASVVFSALLAVSALATVAGIRRLRVSDLPSGPRLGVMSRPVSLVAATASVVAGAAVLAVVAVSSRAFSALALEDGVVENLTAALLLVAAAVLGGRAVGARRRQARSAAALFAVAALACVVLGMEEISWGQRILGFGTPEALSEANTQGEANLHNVATDKLEIVFYSITCLWFVAAGLVRHQLRTRDEHPLAAALPPLAVLPTFAPAAALNSDMWNIAPVQFGFWLTCGALAWLIASPGSAGAVRRVRSVAAATLVVCVALQIGMLASGPQMLRPWDATEYRELWTAAAIVVYAWSLHAAGVRAPEGGDAPVPRAGIRGADSRRRSLRS